MTKSTELTKHLCTAKTIWAHDKPYFLLLFAALSGAVFILDVAVPVEAEASAEVADSAEAEEAPVAVAQAEDSNTSNRDYGCKSAISVFY